MKTVAWLEVHRAPNGGVRYGDMAKEALSKEFAVDLIFREATIFRSVRLLRLPESLLRLSFVRGTRDVWVRDTWSVLTLGFDRTKGKTVAVVYHHDFSGFPWWAKPFFALFHRPLFFWSLWKTGAIVVISEFWRRYFVEKGYPNVIPIYVGFDLGEFDITEEEVQAFRQNHGLTERPIVYLGNCQKAKGVVEAYHALQGLDVHFVTSGTQRVHIPARNFNLTYREYLCLLKASHCALAMSKFNEGWCITAHEAMLLKTPVIGSGKGGMRELLEGGGQIICEDFGMLREKVEFLLHNPDARAKLGESGYTYAKQFSRERFQAVWRNTIRKIIQS